MGRVPSIPDLVDIINNFNGRLKRLETATPLKNASIGRGSVRFSDTGIILGKNATIRSEDWDGNLAQRNAGENGWAISRTLAAFADLVLRPGSIGNDLLTEPVKPQVIKLVATGFGLTTAFVEKDGVDLTVPDGYTRMSINMFGRMYSLNPNTSGGADAAGTDALYVRVLIGANASTATPTGISGNGGFATTNTFDAYNLSGLTPGDTLRFAVQGSSAYQAIAANANNYISAVAQLTWLR